MTINERDKLIAMAKSKGIDAAIGHCSFDSSYMIAINTIDGKTVFTREGSKVLSIIRDRIGANS